MPSAQVTITQLPAAGPITGSEAVPIVQNGQTVQTTTGAISTSPPLTQTFITLNQEPLLTNSRALSGGLGIGLVDGGAQSTLQITLNGASGSLESAGNGFIVKSAGSVINRSLATSANGIAISDANGVAGNPTFSLSGTVGTINALSGTGLLGVVGGSSTTSVSITGTANQIDVANGAGPGNPTISITSNAILPGTGAVTVPSGTTAQTPAGSGGQIRYNTDTTRLQGYQGGSWRNIGNGQVDGGVANQIVYQTAASTTGFVSVPTVTDTFLKWNGSAFVWSAVAGAGTVTSVGLSMPSDFTVTNSPVTAAGTLTAAWASQNSNLFLASPNGTAGTPVFRSINAADVPTLNQNTTGQAGSVANALTMDNSGSGSASGTTYNGSAPITISYNSIGAPSVSGTNATGTWGISISGNAATATASTNLSGGSGGSLPYQTGAGATSFVGIGAVGEVLTSSGTAPQWSSQSTLAVGTATNLAGGAAGSIPYQTGSGATSMLATASGVLVGGTTPSYSTAPTLTGTNFTSIPNGALQNSAITVGTTAISLGGTATTLAGLTSVTVTQPPSSALQLATKQYVDDAVSSGITIHTPVRVETPTALNATYTPGGTAVTATDITGGTTLTFATSPSISVNDQIVFSVTANGIVSGTAYYVYSAPAANQVTLSLSFGGPEITTFTNGTGLTITGTVNAGVGAILTNAGANAAIQIDGVNLSSTNRVLVYNQANAAHNGIYTVTTVGNGSTPWVLTRATDADRYVPNSPTGMSQGDYVFVQEGLTGAGESYVLTTNNPIIIGTTNLTYTQFSASQVYSAGTGLTLTGTIFSLTSPVLATLGGTGITGYATGDLIFANTSTTLDRLTVGANGYVLASNGTAPGYVAQSTLSVGSATTATNVSGGAAGSLVYQTGSNATTTLNLGSSGYLLTAGATAPQWSDPGSISIGTATNAANVAVTATSVNATFYPAFVDATSGNQAVEVDSDLTYNPSTNTLTAGTVVATTGIFGGTF